MSKFWNRETLRFVDKWACKDGTPEDDEDRRSGLMVEDEKSGNTEGREHGVLGGYVVQGDRLIEKRMIAWHLQRLIGMT
jgi:hypothetical protein